MRPARDRERAQATLPLLGRGRPPRRWPPRCSTARTTASRSSRARAHRPQAGRRPCRRSWRRSSRPATPPTARVAAQGLRAVDPTDHDVLLALIRAARDPDATVRDAALMAAVTGLLAARAAAGRRGPRGGAGAARGRWAPWRCRPSRARCARPGRPTTKPRRWPRSRPRHLGARPGLRHAQPARSAARRLRRQAGGRPRCRRGARAARLPRRPRRAAAAARADRAGRAEVVGHVGVPRLLVELDGNEPMARWAAGHALGLIGPQDDEQLALDAARRVGRGPHPAPAARARPRAGAGGALESKPQQAADWRAGLDALGADAQPPLQALVDAGGPHAATAAALLAAPH